MHATASKSVHNWPSYSFLKSSRITLDVPLYENHVFSRLPVRVRQLVSEPVMLTSYSSRGADSTASNRTEIVT
jgi:hypothetical protein